MSLRTGVLVTALCLLCVAGTPSSLAEPRATEASLSVAAERGDAEAEYQFARALLTGQGAAHHPDESLRWMRKAAAQGHPDALGGVGYFYAKGIAVPLSLIHISEPTRLLS